MRKLVQNLLIRKNELFEHGICLLQPYAALLQYKVGRRLGDGQGGSVPLSHQLGVGGAEPGGAPLDVNNVLLTQALTRQRVAPVLTTKKKHHHCPSLCLTGGRGGGGL